MASEILGCCLKPQRRYPSAQAGGVPGGSWRALHALGTEITFVCDAGPQLPALLQDRDE